MKTVSLNYFSNQKIFLLCIAILVLFGFWIQIDYYSTKDSFINFFMKYFIFWGVGLSVILVLISKVNLLKNVRNGIIIFNAISIGLLILVLLFGIRAHGARRFLNLGRFTFQPSTLARMSMIFSFAYGLSRIKESIQEKNLVAFITLLFPSLLILVPQYGLIALGKHMSTLAISLTTMVAMMWMAGVRRRFIGGILGVGIIAFILMITFGGKFGSEFRKTRVNIFRKYAWFMPGGDSIHIPGGRDHQARESLIALTAGGLIGVGSNKGLAKYNYISDVNTDYAFTMIAEQRGFIAGFLVIGIYVVLLLVVAREMMKIKSMYLKLLGMGLAFNIFMNAIIHTGVIQSIVIPTGQTLPFVSWGGTSFVVDLASAAIIYNIMIHKGKLYEKSSY